MNSLENAFNGGDALPWSDRLAVGVPAIDSAHRALVAQINLLARTPDGDFDAALRALLATLEHDFRVEESLMRRIGFPLLARHADEHLRVLKALRELVPGVATGDCREARNAVALISRWFVQHLAEMDLPLAVALEQRRSPLAPPPRVPLRQRLAQMLRGA